MKILTQVSKPFTLLFIALGSLTGISCSGDATDTPNTLSAAEAKEGWTLLFDGHSLAGWHVFNEGSVPSAWKVANGELWCDPQLTGGIHGDLVTDSIYTDFDLVFEWKIAKGGNSGVLINVQEEPQYGTTFATGPELQLLDNEHAEKRHRDTPSHLAGAIYDVVGDANQSHPKPFGQWNTSRIRQEAGKVTCWLNGAVTAEVLLGSDEWHTLVATGNLGNFPDFGKALQGRIALQDHTDEVFFRNMKIKRL